MTKKVTIPLSGTKSLVMRFKEFEDEEEVDIDQLLKTDVANVSLEVITMPIILNRFGLMMADCNFNVNSAKLKYETYESRKAKEFRDEYYDTYKKSMSNEKVAEAVATDPGYIALRKVYFQKLKEQEYMNSIYWALKSKNDKLDKISLDLRSGDIEEALITNRLKRFNYIDMMIMGDRN